MNDLMDIIAAFAFGYCLGMLVLGVAMFVGSHLAQMRREQGQTFEEHYSNGVFDND